MSYSLHYVITPLPASDETLFDRIKDAASKRPPNQTPQQSAPSTPQKNTQQTNFNAIKSVPVSQMTVGPRHVAILLEDGRICRATYQVNADRLEFSNLPAGGSFVGGTGSGGSSSSSISGCGGGGANITTSHSHGPSNAAQLSSLAPSSASSSNASHHHSHHHSHNPSNPSSQVQQLTLSNSSVSTISKAPLSASSSLVGSAPGISSVITSGNHLVAGFDGSRNTAGSSSGSTSNPGGSSGIGVQGSVGSGSSGVSSFSSRVNIAPQIAGLSVQHRQAARRGRMLRQTATRGRGDPSSVIMGSRSIIPAQYVPEDLINQAQVVLQGKPRSAIVRELQRTNLDVNSAVNNLLSSDNEDPEDMDESQDYLPNEDLMSLLDSSVNLQSGPTSVLIDAETVFPEDVFNSYSASRTRPSGGIRHSAGSARTNPERDSTLASELEIRRLASRDPNQSRRWLEHALRDPTDPSGRLSSATPTDFTLYHKSESNHQTSFKKSSSPNQEINPIHISETFEIWPGSERRKFVQIASMHSELIAISSNGQIHQWKWSDPLPFEGVRLGDIVNYHPKVAQLNLTHEKVKMLSASCVRATVVTDSSKVATWIDDSISIVANKLEHAAQNYIEFQKGDTIVQLQTCSLYTCIRLESGNMYWWGVAPFSQRKKNWKKIQSKSSKHSSGGSGSNEIGVGSIVCLKNGPSFGDGAIGFTTKDGIPRVGRLTCSAWGINDICTFKIIQPASEKKAYQPHQQIAQAADTKGRTRKLLGQPLDFSGNSVEDQPPSSPGVSKTSTTERLEMPPPPSPASSTCSEPGCSPSHKRKHKHISMKDDSGKDEEQWNLKDVIFLEEVKKPPAAKVIKLDGNTALVRFNQRDPFGHQSDSDVNAYLQDCRMIRKDELQLAKETTSSSRIIDCQRSPKRLTISDSNSFLTFAVSNNGIHALVKNGNKITYKMYQLASGKVSKSLSLPTNTQAFLGRDSSLITLYACGEGDVAVTLRDGNGSLYPLSKDSLDSLKEPQPLDMSPVQALGMAVHPLRDPSNPNKVNPTLVIAMALESQIVIPAVLRSDPEFVKLTLASLEREPVSQQIVASEKIDLNRNIIHVAVYSCAPTPTRDTSDRSKVGDESFESYSSRIARSGALSDSLKRALAKQSNLSSGNNSTLNLSSDGDSRSMQSLPELEGTSQTLGGTGAEWTNTILPKLEIDPNEQKHSAHLVLLILVECPFLRPYLKGLMMQRDAHGMTPFMSAVSCRAYTAAMILLDLAQWIVDQQQDNEDADQRQKLFQAMIFPPGVNLDNNPLYMLCANDTCSFTWTGAQHINQDIFECKTCGLTRTLCCCTECARTCHKGHDCRLKKTSPTAYCDCWEKCKCKSLVAGSHFARFKLLERLLADTDLVTYPDSRGESILLFLVQTVGRQMIEQRQYAPERSSRHSKRDDPVDMPHHDLSPPRFARKALHKMLGEWLALKTVIMAGTSSSHNLASAARISPLLNVEDQIVLSSQQGTALLDRFTHSLLIKIGPEMLDVLLTTIIRESSSLIPSRVYEARLVAKRFVRSVARNGVVLSVELSPVNYSQTMNTADIPGMFNQLSGGSSSYSSSSSWKLAQQPAAILQKCRKVFQALLPIAAEELAEIADALISPVRLGVPRPTAPFSLVNSMAEATQGSEEIFVVEPVVLPGTSGVDTMPPRQSASTSTSVQLGGLVASASNETSAALNDNSSASSPDRMRELLYDNNSESMVIDAIDSEDAEASNNTFRPSNNGESDSDSDSNPDDVSLQSNIEPSGARSTATVATLGSEVAASTVAYFSEESVESSNAEEEDDESDGNDTEHDKDDMSFSQDDSFAFSRRTNASVGAHSNHPEGSSSGLAHQHQFSFRSPTNLGQHLHWALRHRDHSFYPTQLGSNALPSTAARLASMGFNAYNYIEGTPVRRSVITSGTSSSGHGGLSAPGTSGAPTSALAGNHSSELSMSTTAVGLSRAFSIIIRSISDLIPILKESGRSDCAMTINQLKVSPTEAAAIICKLEEKLNPVWEWLFRVIDSTESQLRFGCALTNGIQAAAQTAVAQVGSALAAHSHQQSRLAGTNNGGNSASVGSTSIHTALSGPPLLAANSYFPPGSNLLPVHPTVMARVNANLSAHSLNRRMPSLFDEPVRLHGSSSRDSSTSGSGAADVAAARLHHQMGQQSTASRPQSLTTRPNPNYVSRMPLDDGPEASLSGTEARRDFLSYMISLIRGHGNEHHDSLPILDVSALRHVAYVFDAYMYYLSALNREKDSKAQDDWSDDEDLSSSTSQRGPRHSFFRRSESTLYLDGATPDSFNTTLAEALPLAAQPHLLQPNSRREDLFGVPKNNMQSVNLDSLPMQLSLSSPSNTSCPKCLAAKQQATSQALFSTGLLDADLFLRQPPGQGIGPCPEHRRPTEFKSDVPQAALLSRWRLTVELFGREFLDDVGAEPGSILTDFVSFPMKENKFRKEMDRLRSDSAPREISLTNVDRDKTTLIKQTIKELNSTYHQSERTQSRRNNLELPLLACSKVKVSFKDEKGEGNGVARSFYTAFCEAVLSNELTNLDAPLFYQPGLRNFYSPRQGEPTQDRLNAFRNVGRVIGICLSQSEICPIQLNRHVIKYILRKPMAWHDLAFFDPVLYESLRQLIVDVENNADSSKLLQTLDLRFCVDLCVEEGGGQAELAVGGSNIEVTPNSVYEYVRRYALRRMLKSQEKSLQAMRQGVMDVLPPCALDNLTAEDFRLLLNGVGEINVQTLIGYTTFIDDRGTSAGKRNPGPLDEQLNYFKKWFWSIVEKMTTKERQDLVYFWTGSPSLPASEEGFQPMPTVSIRPAEDLHLPTSNVCIFRLYIPLYSSKAILRSKLLVAIKEKNFGFI